MPLVSLRQLLDDAAEHGYGLPAFNINNRGRCPGDRDRHEPRRLQIQPAAIGWERWVGDEGAIVGLDHYGASAPAGTIFEHLGFTVERVTDVGRRVVREGLRGRIPTLSSGHKE